MNTPFNTERDKEDIFISLAVIALFLWLFLGSGIFKKPTKANVLSKEVALNSDIDGDGIIDIEDACPTLYGQSENGCPNDTDGDGVIDKYDDCPTEQGLKRNNGCPIAALNEYDKDSDGDGIVDANDECPAIKAKTANGCPPDRDGDGIIDSKDKCPVQYGTAENDGCPSDTDTDGDGIVDELDDCPDKAGTKENNGCPQLVDTDGDGVPDEDDQCPLTAGDAANNGCPADTDGDGIIDAEDRCPEQAGTASNDGCPELQLNQEEQAVLDAALHDVEFETGSAKLKTSSLAVLNQIKDILNNHPDARLTINGHTDNQAGPEINQPLSLDRANACKTYLVSQGVAESKISTNGYGQSRPEASNDTEEGRQSNRRVEFIINY